MPVNLYDIPGVDTACTRAAIVGAYRKLARQYHPDKNPGDAEAQNMFCRISAAYQLLIQEEIREQLRNGTLQCMEDGAGKLCMVPVTPGDHTVFEAAKAWVAPKSLISGVPVRGKAPFIPEHLRDDWQRTSGLARYLRFFCGDCLWDTRPDSRILTDLHTRLITALAAEPGI